MTDTRATLPDMDAAAIETTLAAQGIRLAPGRAAKMVAPLAAAIGPALSDPLQFDQDPAGHALAVARCLAGSR